jgi:ABC-2 type transport system ATP-binding protein
LSGIESHGLTKVFGSFMAVNNLTFRVEDGEVLALLGPNGAGKTTTIRMLSCLITPTSGDAYVAGYSILKEAGIVRRSVGILTESPSLYERLTAVENLDFFAQAYGMNDPLERISRIRQTLEKLGLWERRNDRVSTYSKGMKQKLAFARAILHKPQILFLDEPTSNLDPSSARMMREEIHSMSKKEGRAILLSTHRLEDVERLADRVIIIREGRLVAEGTPRDIEFKAAGVSKLEVRVRGNHPELREKILGIVGVTDVEVTDEGGRFVVGCDALEEVTPQVVRLIVGAGCDVLSVQELRGSLEDAYLNLLKEGKGA